MAKKTIEVVDIELKREGQIKSVLQAIADLYDDPYKVIYEYIANSIDSANTLRIKNGGKSFPFPIKIIVSVLPNKDIVISDNCTGVDMGTFRGLAQSIFDSRKKSVPWAIGIFGFGIHSFRAFFGGIRFRTRTERSGSIYELSFKRDKIKGNEIIEYSGKDSCFQHPSTGTTVELTGLDRKKVNFKSFSHKKLIEQIELHFENILREPDISIKVKKRGYIFSCKAFDYNSIDGDDLIKDVPLKMGNKTYKIHVHLKVSKEPMKERLPRFTSKNIRVNEIAFCESFVRESSDPLLWEHPNLVGYIEVGDVLDPELERSDFPTCEEREEVYKAILRIETEIKKMINKIEDETSVESLNKFGGILENIFSEISDDDELMLREALRKSRIGEKPDLFVSGDGGAEVFGEGGPGPGPGGKDGTGGLGEGSGEGLGGTGKGEEIGEGENGIGITPSKSGIGAKKRKTSGLSVEFRHLGEDKEMAIRIHREFGYVIVINMDHPNWKEREKVRSGRVDLSDGRIPAYCAQLIATFYVQLRNEKWKSIPKAINDEVYFDFTNVTCRAEALLYKKRSALREMIITNC